MKRIILLSIILIFLITGMGFAFQGTKFAYIELSDKQQLKIEYGNDIIYGRMRSKKGEGHNFYLYKNYFKIHGDTIIKNNLVKIMEYNLKIKYTSLTADIATVNEFGVIDWKSEGLAKFKISAFDFAKNAELGNTIIEVKVIKLPLYLSMPLEGVYDGMPLEEVIEKFGFPDKETQTYFEWYDKSGWFEGIWYYFSSVDVYGVTIKHWSYNKYPYLKIWVGDSSIHGVYTQGWDSGYDIGLYTLY